MANYNSALLVRLRKERKLTLRQVASSTGIAKSSLCHLELGNNKNPGATVLSKLAEFYGTKLETILDKGNHSAR